MTARLPDFIYAGTGKAGTTWLFERLRQHPDVFLTDVKETNFFDLNFDRGTDWYGRFFDGAAPDQRIGEIAHRYLRTPGTAARIHDTLGPMKIVVGLREPADYVLSDYLFTRRNGGTDKTVAGYMKEQFDWSAIQYAALLRPYVDTFGADNIHVCDFSLLARDPQTYLDGLTDFLGVSRYTLSDDQTTKVNKAKAARSKGLSSIISRGSKWLKRRGGQRIIQAVKSQPLVQKTLYRDLNDKPQMPTDLRDDIVRFCADEIAQIDHTLGTQLQISWYPQDH